MRHIHYKNKTTLMILGLIICLGLAGCQAAYLDPGTDLVNWKYSDLRLLDPVDSLEPKQDLIALYTRKIDDSFQIRLDFLDLDSYLGNDIYIAIDTNPDSNQNRLNFSNYQNPAGFSWDYLVKINDFGRISVIDNKKTSVINQRINSVYDVYQDWLVLDFIHNRIPVYPGFTKLQAIVTKPGSPLVVDQTDPFNIDTLPPPKSKVLLVFWNTFSSVTPAQALRSWAGAHSGLMSSRHGMKYLLDDVARTYSPVFFYDFLSRENISALDYMGNDDEVTLLVSRNIINSILINKENEEVFYFEEEDKSILFIDYGYAHYFDFPYDCQQTHEYRTFEKSDAILSLSLSCKVLMISTANNPSSSLLVFGGDFALSPLGDPAVSSEVFGYISSHPWIQVLTREDLLAYPDMFSAIYAQSAVTSPTRIADSDHETQVKLKIADALSASPDNRLTQLTQSVFDDLNGQARPDLAVLRAGYLNQLGFLLKAAEWAAAPLPIQTCTLDLDFDDASECIFADQTKFLVIEPQGGYIPFFFSIDAQGVHQIIGPTWEFVVGLSDPSTWQPNLGIRADSAQILGALQNPFSEWEDYTAQIENDYIYLIDNRGAISRSFTLTADGVDIQIQTPPNATKTLIPLAVDPWTRFTPDWGKLYFLEKSNRSSTWGLHSGIRVRISSSVPISTYAFNDTFSMMSKPEDPNFDYSPGHYLPFPMAVVEVDNSDEYSISVDILPLREPATR
ncbi:MAG: hypothetical protein C3F13_10150 [Anaerolineales bacterium]|nr:MAG: hypothetical protein C3F13_10150 [Anaerolineales bacterium]